ncbi:response regulator [Microcoleus sp. FACHB-831]|uniref:response regulator n=1 Tax=Microcoleus sp. FACHB-831 TaxID=2692827 RepID=UPI001688EC5F|nr:response regulator [Microcoleus sp. FACHB-831]MBD1921162.1 response regulator [Microcoleus sp. FACHB-831]
MALILVVEDAWLSRRMMSKVLENDGHTILQATNGREGLEMVRTHNPDCIFLDLLMPEVDGLDVLKTLQDEGSKIPIVVITADIQQSTRQQCLELGAIAVINKPSQPPEILQALKTALSFHQETAP